MKEVKKRKEAEASSLSRMGTAILKGNRLGVQWIPDGSDALGYTSGEKKVVHVAWYNAYYFEKLEETERSALRMGIFAHELLHQCLTNFEYTKRICETMSQAEAAVFMKFANTLEDPAIEFFAPNIFGGRLLESLRFSIHHIYRLSIGIDKSKTAFSQLINALIHFGDMGIVKGSFTFPEAKEYFAKVAPLYNEGITCPDSKRRIDIAKECMEITRPLWEEEVKDHEAFEELLKELIKALAANGLHLLEDEECDMEPGEESEAGERRTIILEKIKKTTKADDVTEESENGTSVKMEENEKVNEEENDSNSDNETSSKDEKESDLTLDDSVEDKDETSESNTNDSKDTTSDEKNADDGMSSKGENEDGKTKEENNSQSDSEGFGGENDDITTPEDVANELIDGEYIIDDEILNSIESSINAEADRLEKQSAAEGGNSESSESLPDFDISSNAFKSAKCLNQRVKNTVFGHAAEMYAAEVANYSWEIKNLKKTLDKIFKSDMEEQNRATSGSYNIKRGAIGTSARIFDKRREPGNLKDAAVVLAVDLSGSMGGIKVAQARKTSIILAEALSALKIPYYIMGFSADRDGADAVHTHFVDWKNKKTDRISLISMHAGGNNFDGYSIRYAAELLKAKNVSNKILFIISDGEPACYMYCGNVGLSDTTNAIKESRKYCTVFGIALGRGCNPRVLQKMYGKDFIHCENEELLSNTLCKKLEKVFKSKK